MKTITETIEKYITEVVSDPLSRYSSWDNCRKAFSDDTTNENTALHLGFYLASWGMYRGSGGLLQRNHLVHLGPVEIFYSGRFEQIKCHPKREVEQCDIQNILKLGRRIAAHYSNITYQRGSRSNIQISATDTLVTKVMLGTFGCVPAYDQYFVKGLKLKKIEHTVFNETSLVELFGFIDLHRSEIEDCQALIKKHTGRHYPVMKILDMFFWTLGYELMLLEQMEKINKKIKF